MSVACSRLGISRSIVEMLASFIADKDRIRRVNLLAGMLLVSTKGGRVGATGNFPQENSGR